MESPTLARYSVPTNVSEFARAELEAFVAMSECTRPQAWARVQSLQAACRAESPRAAAGCRAFADALGEHEAARVHESPGGLFRSRFWNSASTS